MCTQDTDIQIEVIMNNEIITANSNMKILGTHMDSRQNCNGHVDFNAQTLVGNYMSHSVGGDYWIMLVERLFIPASFSQISITVFFGRPLVGSH